LHPPHLVKHQLLLQHLLSFLLPLPLLTSWLIPTMRVKKVKARKRVRVKNSALKAFRREATG
jgi:hypothetical protein